MVLKVQESTFYSSIAQSVEHAAVNRAVVGSSPTRGAFYYCPVLPGLNRLTEAVRYDSINKQSGPMVKRLRHRPFTAVTRVRISLGSFELRFTHHADVAQLAEQLICNQQVIGSSPIIGFLDL